MAEAKIDDPFREARQKDGVLQCPFQGENLPMILRHADVREAAKDWKTYSSDAPFRVPIPSEEEVRSMRQLPIETNAPGIRCHAPGQMSINQKYFVNKTLLVIP